MEAIRQLGIMVGNVLSFAIGAFGAYHEIAVAPSSEEHLLIFCGALMGVPIIYWRNNK